MSAVIKKLKKAVSEVLTILLYTYVHKHTFAL